MSRLVIARSERDEAIQFVTTVSKIWIASLAVTAGLVNDD